MTSMEPALVQVAGWARMPDNRTNAPVALFPGKKPAYVFTGTAHLR
jgi:hypothetical protein